MKSQPKAKVPPQGPMYGKSKVEAARLWYFLHYQYVKQLFRITGASADGAEAQGTGGKQE